MGLFGRLYNDYWMPGRWADYRAFLVAAKDNGYRFVLHQDAPDALSAGEGRLFFLRHDIDTDLDIARTMFAIEKELGVHSTYYFRRCTADVGLMREILAFGSEVGYHYEELSDHIKQAGLRDREQVYAEMPAIRQAFLRNFKAFEDQLGAKVITVAAHGDHANRAMGIRNTALMDDAIRAATGIRLEAYDELLVGRLSFRAADALYPDLWLPSSPIEAMKAAAPVVLLLVHPRHWQGAPLSRFRTDLHRLYEGIHYRLHELK